MKTSTCCGAPLWGTEDPICSECKEHCDYEIIEDEPSQKCGGFLCPTDFLKISGSDVVWQTYYNPRCTVHVKYIVWQLPINIRDYDQIQKIP
jgi:hypothetical protein